MHPLEHQGATQLKRCDRPGLVVLFLLSPAGNNGIHKSTWGHSTQVMNQVLARQDVLYPMLQNSHFPPPITTRDAQHFWIFFLHIFQGPHWRSTLEG